MGRLIVLVATAALVLAPSARAHGGSVVGTGKGNGYTMTVQAASVTMSAGDMAADLTAYPINDANGAPVTDATLTFRIDDGPPQSAKLVAGAYELEVPMDRRGEWRSWQISATVTGAAGSLTVTGAPVAGAEDGPAPGWVVPSLVVLVALALLLIVRRAQLRRADVDYEE